MNAPVRRVRTTRFGEYLQVGDKSVFVPMEASINESKKLNHLDVEIKSAGFTDGSVEKSMPDFQADIDEKTKESLVRYYEQVRPKQPTNYPWKLIY